MSHCEWDNDHDASSFVEWDNDHDASSFVEWDKHVGSPPYDEDHDSYKGHVATSSWSTTPLLKAQRRGVAPELLFRPPAVGRDRGVRRTGSAAFCLASAMEDVLWFPPTSDRVPQWGGRRLASDLCQLLDDYDQNLSRRSCGRSTSTRRASVGREEGELAIVANNNNQKKKRLPRSSASSSASLFSSMVTGAIEQALSPLYQWIPLDRFNVCDVTTPFPIVALFPNKKKKKKAKPAPNQSDDDNDSKNHEYDDLDYYYDEAYDQFVGFAVAGCWIYHASHAQGLPVTADNLYHMGYLEKLETNIQQPKDGNDYNDEYSVSTTSTIEKKKSQQEGPHQYRVVPGIRHYAVVPNDTVWREHQQQQKQPPKQVTSCRVGTNRNKNPKQKATTTKKRHGTSFRATPTPTSSSTGSSHHKRPKLAPPVDSTSPPPPPPSGHTTTRITPPPPPPSNRFGASTRSHAPFTTTNNNNIHHHHTTHHSPDFQPSTTTTRTHDNHHPTNNESQQEQEQEQEELLPPLAHTPVRRPRSKTFPKAWKKKKNNNNNKMRMTKNRPGFQRPGFRRPMSHSSYY